MDLATITLQQPDETGLAYVESLLEANGLPSADVESNPERFYVGYDGNQRIGIGGLELYGTDGLLRSLVVEESARGSGFGTALCETLETKADAEDVETLYLLTTTAPEFFASRGYTEVERSEPPERIQQTTEFEELCPASATCMKKSL